MNVRSGLGISDPYRPVSVVEDRVAATFAACDEPPPWYELKWFADPEAPALYVSAVAVRPERQRGGLRKRCIAAAEGIGGARGCTALRLDTTGENAPAQESLRYLGYEQRSPLDHERFRIVSFGELLWPAERAR